MKVQRLRRLFDYSRDWNDMGSSRVSFSGAVRRGQRKEDNLALPVRYSSRFLWYGNHKYHHVEQQSGPEKTFCTRRAGLQKDEVISLRSIRELRCCSSQQQLLLMACPSRSYSFTSSSFRYHHHCSDRRHRPANNFAFYSVNLAMRSRAFVNAILHLNRCPTPQTPTSHAQFVWTDTISMCACVRPSDEGRTFEALGGWAAPTPTVSCSQEPARGGKGSRPVSAFILQLETFRPSKALTIHSHGLQIVCAHRMLSECLTFLGEFTGSFMATMFSCKESIYKNGF